MSEEIERIAQMGDIRLQQLSDEDAWQHRIRVVKEIVDALDRVRDARGDDEGRNAGSDPDGLRNLASDRGPNAGLSGRCGCFRDYSEPAKCLYCSVVRSPQGERCHGTKLLREQGPGDPRPLYCSGCPDCLPMP